MKLVTRMRSGGGWQTEVEADARDARKAKPKLKHRDSLRELEIAGVAAPDGGKLTEKGANAEAIVAWLWGKECASANELNDLGVALAWLSMWDDALDALERSEKAAASDDDRKRAQGNREIVKKAKP
jgi:hypothetical protein